MSTAAPVTDPALTGPHVNAPQLPLTPENLQSLQNLQTALASGGVNAQQVASMLQQNPTTSTQFPSKAPVYDDKHKELVTMIQTLIAAAQPPNLSPTLSASSAPAPASTDAASTAASGPDPATAFAQHFPYVTAQTSAFTPGPAPHTRAPDLGQLSAAAAQQVEGQGASDGEDGDDDGQGGGDGQGTPPSKGGRRTTRSSNMSNDEWARQRKDNHKEVERRRRGNINDGINELGRIVPNGTGEKAKGAILSRAVQYIHHLKENEARNIEKWTLEKLLMDQAMGDLQAQLEEMRRLWEEERQGRARAEGELEVLRGVTGAAAAAATKPPSGNGAAGAARTVAPANGEKRERDEKPVTTEAGEKRQRVE